MTEILNLADIQGNITRAYGRFSFPFARYFFLNIADPGKAREFVEAVRGKITTAQRWTKDTKPNVTMNIGFSFFGLYYLGVPNQTMAGLPNEFIDGMKLRAFVLGDSDPTKVHSEKSDWCKHWDPIWQDNREDKGEDVHIWISMNAQLGKLGSDQPHEDLEKQTQWLRDLCEKLGQGVRILKKNGKNGDQEFQAASAVFEEREGALIPTAKEHFGFTDGISDPVFKGQYPQERMATAVQGRGKWMDPKKGWQPLETGEFILGHPDESQELPPCARPTQMMRNGSFMVYRKLHENVASFEEVIAEEAETYAAQYGVDTNEAAETLKAKMVGRWSDGVPLQVAPDWESWKKFRKDNGFDDPDPAKAAQAHYRFLKSDAACNFKYGDDMDGFLCPSTSHIRRVNPRDYLDPLNKQGEDNPNATTQLNKRRRILRRGLPYGPTVPKNQTDDTEQGVAMMMICASLFRQFEFVQQQWIQYGLDFNAGNNTCPMLGSHEHHKRHIIPSDPASGKPPFVMSRLKTFVETRGGEYFFLPSMTALRMLAMGIVDPT